MQDILAFITLLIMVVSLGLILVPAVPVSALEWALAMVAMALSIILTGDTAFTPLSIGIVTILAAIGSTSGWWLPYFGLRGRGLSCMGMLAFFGGMLIGSILIPIPFIGTIAGGMLGIMLVEYGRIGEWRTAWESGQAALRIILYSMLAELVFAVAIIAVFVVVHIR